MINIFACGIKILRTQQRAYSFLLIDDNKSRENEQMIEYILYNVEN